MGDLRLQVSYVFHLVSHRDVDLIVGTQQGMGDADQDNLVQIPYSSTSSSITNTMGLSTVRAATFVVYSMTIDHDWVLLCSVFLEYTRQCALSS
jgi:hypothetical protein